MTRYLTSLRPEAPNMTGIARKNVNLDATARVQPRSRPPMMVEPEREVPGISESTWNRPIPRAVFQLSSSSEVMLPKSSSRPSAAEVAKCAPAGRAPGSGTPLSRKRARRVSITMNATP